MARTHRERARAASAVSIVGLTRRWSRGDDQARRSHARTGRPARRTSAPRARVGARPPRRPRPPRAFEWTNDRYAKPRSRNQMFSEAQAPADDRAVAREHQAVQRARPCAPTGAPATSMSGIAADDAIERDDVGRLDRRARAHEVAIDEVDPVEMPRRRASDRAASSDGGEASTSTAWPTPARSSSWSITPIPAPMSRTLAPRTPRAGIMSSSIRGRRVGSVPAGIARRHVRRSSRRRSRTLRRSRTRPSRSSLRVSCRRWTRARTGIVVSSWS